jgi:uncharacterized protein YndB with AHSA1/START domain
MSSTSDREIVTTRVLDAPRELVFKAWIDPDRLAQWWGPKGFTNTFQEFDPRPGGTWRFVMHGPDGVDYKNESVFVEIVKPERIVFQHVSGPRFQMTATFVEQAGKTRLTWRMLFESAAACDRVKTLAVEANEQNLDRLEAQLAHMASATDPLKQEFVITRVLDAPRDIVWKAWTDPELLMKWWGPKGFTVRVSKMDLRPNGVYHYCLRAPDGNDLWGKWVLREIAAPERLVWINSFSDEAGNVTRHPMSPSWPLEMLSTLTLAEDQGRTTLTVRWAPHAATEAERKTFEAGHASMQQGWTGTLDQLAGYLAKA